MQHTIIVTMDSVLDEVWIKWVFFVADKIVKKFRIICDGGGCAFSWICTLVETIGNVPMIVGRWRRVFAWSRLACLSD